AGQLEDDPDLDARVAQPSGLAFEVGDVDVRDAVVVRLAMREPALHLAPLKRRPAPIEVDRDLLEAEQIAVEAAPLVEVADVVPDRGRHRSPTTRAPDPLGSPSASGGRRRQARRRLPDGRTCT